MSRTFRRPAPDGVEQHRNWLSLVEVSGPFLSLPVLRRTWPTLDTLDRRGRDRLRQQHTTWQVDTVAGQADWIGYVLDELLGWGDARHTDGLDALAHTVAEHDTELRPSFVLVEPGEAVKPDGVRLIGLVCPPGQQPTARVTGSTWAATPADRLALLCRHHRVELGLATDGRWWTLVWAPRGGVTTTATFDAVAWPEAAERDVVRAFVSVLSRHRFFGVPDAERLVPLLRDSLGSQEEITEALGVQVRQAVELLVAAIGRTDVRERDAGGPGLAHVEAHEVYRGAVAVMMRIVFLLFAEERRLLPADNELYAAAYSAGRLCAELEQRVTEGSEEDLEHSSAAWHRLLALFTAVYHGIDHPRLTLHGHDGSLFDPKRYDWLPLAIDDRTVLHMLRSVQYVQVGTGRSRERRTVSFRTLDVEQIGYVYEGLLSFEGFRAQDVTVGLIGKEGLEDEVALADLETLRERHPDVPSLAKALAERHKDSKIGSVAALTRKLVPLDGAEREEARRKLLAVTGGDYPLSERLLPFHGIVRADLRGLPVVILPGALFVTESALRRNTGTHYTPRFLAEEVVEGALEPLVYEPGPLQTADKAQWKPKSSKEILALKVADIAMGSAAFLVAAARYLAGHLIAAWSREGDELALAYQQRDADRTVDADDDPLVVEARRQIIEHCLYGVDINPMAVEMAKLSLWLVSMDPQRPFTFLDDRLVAGDSLLGITSLEQLEHMHLDAQRGRELHEGALHDFTSGMRSLVTEVADDRRGIAELDLGDDPMAAVAKKRELLKEATEKTELFMLFADLAVGASLANASRGGRGIDTAAVEAASIANDVASGVDKKRAQERRSKWLAADCVPGSFDRKPLHWPLVFPEVFEREGFDAIVGNPPFVKASKIRSISGSAYRDHLVQAVAGGAKGVADFVAYFVLRAQALLAGSGQMGVIATSSLANGYTREVGLDQIVRRGVIIRRAVRSEPWPSHAAVRYCAVWASQSPCHGLIVLDGNPVAGINSSLESVSRVEGKPLPLSENQDFAYVGSNINGLGFTVDPAWAADVIEKDSKCSEVLRPYINGEDLNGSPTFAPGRWVINFHGFDGERYVGWSQSRAMEYPACYLRVERLVKPEREGRSDLKLRRVWWQFKRPTPALYESIAKLQAVVVLAQSSSTAIPVMMDVGPIFDQKIIVFASDDPALLSLLSSCVHYWWALRHGSALKADLSYTPSKIFQTLPLPVMTDNLRALGVELDTYRRNVMLRRQAGLTATYNLVFDPAYQDEDIVELRRIHRDIDVATCRAYDWDDLVEQGLDHGFHKAGAYTRYTVGPAVQREILDRLLELNHQRYAEEVAQGLHDKKKSGRKPPSGPATLF
ncbi:Eco57I restriction-modification methylase domain-containing protein [Micromonospora haikouensis]|uniref:Eco57I restriction-modification methylase domain-containing protein n=1 Tax=Micromonospora haikouensis TaxID=686309 RepID=UPI003794651A